MMKLVPTRNERVCGGKEIERGLDAQRGARAALYATNGSPSFMVSPHDLALPNC
jgi:hypothetical protein